jgi:hypothetical protein
MFNGPKTKNGPNPRSRVNRGRAPRRGSWSRTRIDDPRLRGDRIDNRAGGHLQFVGGEVMLHLVEQPAAEITGFESEAKAAQGGFVGRWLMREIDFDKTALRLRIVDRVFDRWIRQIERLNQCC